MSSSVLCVTPGDPAGIGPEITVKFLARHLHRYPQTSFHIIGSRMALDTAAAQLGIPLPEQPEQIRYTDVVGNHPGAISYRAIEQAVQALISGKADALVTGPIAKENLKAAGVLASGHTEILEYLARTHYPALRPKAEMLFSCRGFRMLLLTRHVPLSQVASELISQNVRQALESLTGFLQQHAGIETPRIAMLGVNPHAGEVGGVEETLILAPVMEQLNALGNARFEGPFAADAFFRGFDMETQPYHAVVAAYHDQGLIPFKLLAGYKAVNVTLGLPFIRTSVGHGTAFDIAGKGIATEESLVEAVDTALQLVVTKARQTAVTAY